MSLMRFKVAAPLNEGDVVFEGEEARHLAAVNRVRVGDEVTAFDGSGRSARVRVTALMRDRVLGATVQAVASARPPSFDLELWCGLPRAGAAEDVVRSAVEVGATAIRPLVTERGVWQPENERAERRRARFEKVAVAALKQCGRDFLPRFDEPLSVSDAVIPVGAFACVGATAGEATPIRTALETAGRTFPLAIVIVGPEGGFTPSEVQTLRSAGVVAVSLGPSILRVETACIALLSQVVAWRS